ncbi:uncharacterized protein LOC130976356 [Arachis stenosperma]|uniref:uncharacterized protein LOC130976356 n=1 Tax=Arachis stenosperma TaxID=217475 RepID=UPI0025AD7A84|nr:uncharacterized protein LOC130976356 [Arachis stenosperma]
MGQMIVQVVLVAVMVVLVGVAGATPPGIAKNPSHATCKIKKYKHCYNLEHVCPKFCPDGCTVECASCKPICVGDCDRPGAVCQDPRFIGGDGTTFYFHGKKDTNFCLVSDPNLHINAHFIGRRSQNMKRDFTWVQSIAILFNNNHTLFIGAQKTAAWDDSNDRVDLSFDGQPITLPQSEGATWTSQTSPSVTVSRAEDSATNSVVLEVEGKLKVSAKVVPITEEDSRIHSYGVTEEDCFAHLDLGFKFLDLSREVSGVLGQTYKENYVSRLDIGAKMAVMGGSGSEFESSSLFSTDCSVSRFVGDSNNIGEKSSFEGLSCQSGIDGQGVVCRR